MNWRAIILAMLAVTAGCASLGSQPTRTATVSPAPVPSDTVTDSGPTLPPGVSGGGVVNEDVLVRAHLDALDNRSYVRRVYRSFDGRNSTTTLFVESPTRYRYERAGEATRTNGSGFADGTWLYTRYVQFSSRFNVDEVKHVRSRHGTSVARSIRRYLSLSNATVAKTLVDGELHYAISAERDRYGPIGGSRLYSVEAVLTPDGLVRSLTVSFLTRHDGETTRVIYSHEYEYRQVTVERPAWVDREFGELNESVTDSRTDP